jgi:hypothetical protein
MRGISVFFGVIAAVGLCCAPVGHSKKFASPSSPPEGLTGEEGCEVYFALQPIDRAALKKLATPIVPVNRTVFTDADIRQLQDWDLPSKVTAWRDRPSPEDLARQWDELNKKWSAGAQKKDKSNNDVSGGHAAPYDARSLPAKEWQDLEKWFGKNAPKKVSGLCVDPVKASYVLAVGIISGGASVLPNDPNRVGQYADYASKPLPESLGPNAAKVSPYKTPHDEFTGSGMSDSLAGNTCVYLYRTNGKSLAEGGIRQEAPDYYYCHAGGGISQSTVTTMLKYLAKSGLVPVPQH